MDGWNNSGTGFTNLCRNGGEPSPFPLLLSAAYLLSVVRYHRRGRLGCLFTDNAHAMVPIGRFYSHNGL